VKAVVRSKEVSIAIAVALFFQQFGGCIFLRVTQAVLLNKLLPQMQILDRSLTQKDIIAAGLSGLKRLVTDEPLPALLSMYANSLDWAFRIAIIMGAGAFVMAWFVQWKRPNKLKESISFKELLNIIQFFSNSHSVAKSG
jgi:hypothetical protein